MFYYMKLILGHKGVHYKYPENSLESIIEIFKYKSNKFKFGVEFDINLTKDNKLILFHDELLNNKNINDLFYKEIKLLNKNIPLLEDIFKKFNNKHDYIMNIELKDYPKNKLLYCNTLINLLNKYNLNYFMSSFNKEIYNILKSKNIKCYLLSDEKSYNGDIVHYSKITDNCKGVYTIFDDEFNISYLEKISNIDILITDDINKLIKYFNI